MLMSVWNFWSMEILILMAGYVGQAALAAQTLLRAIRNIMYLSVIGLRTAC